MAVRAPMRKVTVSLPDRMVRDLQAAVAEGAFPSQNELVREALRKELKRVRDERLYREMLEAAQDPEFIRDVEETMEAFKWVDSETARMLPPYDE